MTRILSTCTLLLLLLTSCGKEINTYGEGFDVTGGILGATFSQVHDTTVIINVQPLKGKQEPVNLTLEGIPTGVTATLDQVTGIPPFTARIHIMIDSTQTTPGTYTPMLYGKTTSRSQGYGFQIIVQ